MRLILLFLALSASLTATAACDRQNTEGQQGEAAAGVPTQGVDRSHKGKAFPDVSIRELDHDADTPAESFRGLPTLVNLWATWSLRDRALCSRPAAGPISSVSRCSTCM